jgi:hypothetical protein
MSRLSYAKTNAVNPLASSSDYGRDIVAIINDIHEYISDQSTENTISQALTDADGIKPTLISLFNLIDGAHTSSNRQKVEPLGKLGASRGFALTTASAEVTLTPSCRRVRLTTTVNADYRIGTGTIGAAVSTDHLLLAGTSIDLCVDANSKVAAIRDATATADGVFAITELVEP